MRHQYLVTSLEFFTVDITDLYSSLLLININDKSRDESITAAQYSPTEHIPKKNNRNQ